jgi:SAM-dependent methyltransferase
MAISSLMVHWFEHLANKDNFFKNSDILEFGPQELTTSRYVCNTIANRLIGEIEAKKIISKIFDNDAVTSTFVPCTLPFQKDFYSIFGARSYKSLDLFNDLADYDYDLNHYIPIFQKFDVVTNFGTSEHCFEVGKVFKSAHRLLKPGGVMLSVLPAFGDIDHGFFNIHPTFYRTLSTQSGFELLDLQYIDDIANRSKIHNGSKGNEAFDFTSLPITMVDMEITENFREKVLSNFINNFSKRNEINDNDSNLHVFDYTFVALRRKLNGNFQSPYQYVNSPINKYHNLFKYFERLKSKLIK